jgi:8-amino-7-oxononanoate synthase
MFERDIQDLRRQGLLRVIADRGACCERGLPCGASRITINGVEYLNFSSNDYLGLASSPVLAEAAKQALGKFPFGAGASRLLSGGTELHRLLETKIAAFKGTESALLFNSGYHANISMIPALASERDIIYSDELNHASIIDGCRLSRARSIIYRHGDIGHLSQLLHKDNGARKLIVTDTVFSMDGDLAPIKEIAHLCAHVDGTVLYLDDAHGTGVLGNGRGALAHFNIRPEPWIIQMGTLSKAIGSFGAFVAASGDIIDWLTNTARGLIFSTALPSCVAAASIAALELIGKESALVERLWQNQMNAVEGIKAAGFEIVSEDTPIIAVLVGDIQSTLFFAEKLKMNGIYAPAIRPPTVQTPRIRVTVSAAHTAEDISALVKAFEDLRS